MPTNLKIDVFDPVHQHAAFLFGKRFDDIPGLTIDPTVHVYHSESNPLTAFDTKVANSGAEALGYKFQRHPSSFPLEDMLKSRGDILVLASPNHSKLDVLAHTAGTGYRLILADKPWVIEPERTDEVQELLDRATHRGTILQDIMTERHELGTIVQMCLMQNAELFGELTTGNPEHPALTKKSIHILDKSHQGIVRPLEYFDVGWQGEGIVDVTAHLVDMANMMVRPNSAIAPEDIALVEQYARRWATEVPASNLMAMTKGRSYGLRGSLPVMTNGSFVYKLDGHWVGIEVVWNLQGEDDEHYSTTLESKATIIVEKGPQDKHQRIYVKPTNGESSTDFMKALSTQVGTLTRRGITGASIGAYVTNRNGYEVIIPELHFTNHFAHFTEVAEQAFRYVAGTEPFPREVEYSRLLTKYHLTTQALKAARANMGR
ncbi:MAG TPA: putative oxidoreductase C-terminal domain-containing protein [Candidatus Nanoarchaeia archaeon]|nr:putative oxidoreductase C-terminal domain-containing protein [Candidatus Nanoarchaeia archaeon]